jgi:hypothetical protein
MTASLQLDAVREYRGSAQQRLSEIGHSGR